MERTDNAVEKVFERFRPVLVTLAEAMISPSYRGNIEASDLVQQTLMEAHTHARLLETFDEGPFSLGCEKRCKTICSTLSNT